MTMRQGGKWTMRLVSNVEFMAVRNREVGGKLHLFYPSIEPGAQCYLSDDLKNGLAIYPDGEICHCFIRKRFTRAMNQFAIRHGGTYARMFEGRWVAILLASGYVETHREPFDPAIAPSDWDFQLYGNPDVVTMVYDRDLGALGSR